VPRKGLREVPKGNLVVRYRHWQPLGREKQERSQANEDHPSRKGHQRSNLRSLGNAKISDSDWRQPLLLYVKTLQQAPVAGGRLTWADTGGHGLRAAELQVLNRGVSEVCGNNAEKIL
jgi:hypothetical protein